MVDKRQTEGEREGERLDIEQNFLQYLSYNGVFLLLIKPVEYMYMIERAKIEASYPQSLCVCLRLTWSRGGHYSCVSVSVCLCTFDWAFVCICVYGFAYSNTDLVTVAPHLHPARLTDDC